MSVKLPQLGTIGPTTMLTHEQARQTVIDHLLQNKRPRATTVVNVWEALGYVVAHAIPPRHYPASAMDLRANHDRRRPSTRSRRRRDDRAHPTRRRQDPLRSRYPRG